ncbi:mechanosensitive ion channel protein MscS, partial [Stenotrophomonas maltophilia]
MIAAAPPTPAPAATPWFHSLNWERLLETYGVPLLAAIVVLLVGLWVARRLSNA